MVKIRRAVISDIERVYELGRNLEASKVNEETVAFWPKKILSKITQSKEDIFLVAEKDERVVGYIIINYSPSFGKATIENIFIGESRNQGVGSALFNEGMNILRRKGCKYVCVFTKAGKKETTGWFEKRGLKVGEKFIWSDKILSKDFLDGVKAK